MCLPIQWSLYFKTTHGTIKMWSYTAGTKLDGLIIKVVFKIKGCKILSCHCTPVNTVVLVHVISHSCE